MPLLLTTPIVITNTANSVQITGLYNKIEEGCVEIHYMTLLADGTPYQRGDVRIDGYDAVKALYAETDTVMATGLTFEQASAQILYAKVLAAL